MTRFGFADGWCADSRHRGGMVDSLAVVVLVYELPLHDHRRQRHHHLGDLQ